MMSSEQAEARRADGELLTQRTSASTRSTEDSLQGNLTLSDLRADFVQELYSFLLGRGFDVEIFRSINDDELYICISVKRPDVRDIYLLRDHVNIQLRRHVFQKMQINIPMDEAESSAPYVPYNPHLSKVLCKAKVFETDNVDELYHIKKGKTRAAIRIHTIVNELRTNYHLEAAKKEGLILDWYPCHNSFRLEQLSFAWGNFVRLYDLSFLQPIHDLEEYFGARITFRLAWNGLYCKALLGLLPPAVLSAILVLISGHPSSISWLCPDHGIVPEVYCTEFFSTEDHYMGMSLVIAIWSRIATNLWLREEAFYIEEFDIKKQPEFVREEFEGVPCKSKVDGNLIDKKPDRLRDTFWKIVSTLISSCFVAAAAIGVYFWTDRLGIQKIDVSIMFSMCMVILGKIYSFVATYLCDMENHKYSRDYYNSLVQKTVGFQVLNYYGVLLYVAVKMRSSESGCPKQGCNSEVQRQVGSTVLILIVFRIGMVVYGKLKVRLMVWYEEYEHQKKYGGDDNMRVTFLERQSRWDKIDMDTEIMDFAELVLSLGFLLLFGGVLPFLTPFCLLTFAVELRSAGVQLTTCFQRPVGDISIGIGYWHIALVALHRLGIVMTAFLLCYTGSLFKGAQVLTRIAGMIAFIILTLFTTLAVDTVFPPVTGSTNVLRQRRKHVVTKLSYLSAGIQDAYSGLQMSRNEERVLLGDWHDLPRGEPAYAPGERPQDTPSSHRSV